MRKSKRKPPRVSPASVEAVKQGVFRRVFMIYNEAPGGFGLGLTQDESARIAYAIGCGAAKAATGFLRALPKA